MNEPHVEALHYRLQAENDPAIFDSADPVRTRLGEFEIELADMRLIAEPKAHFADATGARAALEPALRDWETAAQVNQRLRVQFTFERADVIDLNPTPGRVVGVATMRLADDALVAIGTVRSQYPRPDPAVAWSDLVEKLVSHLRRCEDGQEPVDAMAHWLSTCLRGEFSGEVQAASALRVSRNVLRTVARLSGQSVDRKVAPRSRVLTDDERTFLLEAAHLLTRRTAQVAADTADLPQITLADLPRLPSSKH